MGNYFITNPHDQPINVIHDGDGPKIQFSKKTCETYNTPEEAQSRLAYLAGYIRRNPCVRHLKVATYAKGFMS